MAAERAAGKLARAEQERRDAQAALDVFMVRATQLREEMAGNAMQGGAPSQEDTNIVRDLISAIENTWLPLDASCGAGGLPRDLAAAMDRAKRGRPPRPR